MKITIPLFVVSMLLLAHPERVAAASILVGPSDCSAARVNSAIASAADGDTILLTCSGNVSWSTTVTIPSTKGIALKVQGGTNTPKNSATFPLTVASSSDPIIEINCENGRSLSRVSGFKFQNTISSSSGAVFVRGRGTGSGGTGCFRVDNNYFDSIQLPHADLAGTITVWSSTGVLTGVIDNNTLRDSSYTDGYAISIEERWQYGGSGWAFAGQNAWTRPMGFGSSDFIFVEDNLIENVNRYTRHLIEAIQGGKYVARYNTFATNKDNGGVETEQVEAHGFCFCSSIGHGTRGGEVYKNTFRGTKVGYHMNLRGGTWLVYDNLFDNPAEMVLKEYRAGDSAMCSQCSATCPSDPKWAYCAANGSHYPMSEQISGTYFWNNTYNGINQSPSVDQRGVQRTYIQPGRDYFVSSGKPAALSTYGEYAYPHPLRTVGDTTAPLSPPQNLQVR
jgi:hypothetical protein